MRTLAHFTATVLILASSSAQAASTAHPSDPWEITFDDRAWSAAHQGTDPATGMRIVEYTVAGESVGQWTELVTSSMLAAEIPVARLREVFEASLRKDCPSAEVKTLQKKKDSVLFEWKHQGCGGQPPQHEIRRHVHRAGAVLMLAYVARGSAMNRQRLELWRGLLLKARARSTSVAAKPAPGRTRFRISGGEVHELPTAEGMPLPASDADGKVEVAGINMEPGFLANTYALFNSFAVTIRRGSPPVSVKVEDVSEETARQLIDDAAPRVDANGAWSGRTPGVLIGRETIPWLYEPGDTTKVFRIRIGFADGAESIYLQPAVFSEGFKRAVLGQVARGGS